MGPIFHGPKVVVLTGFHFTYAFDEFSVRKHYIKNACGHGKDKEKACRHWLTYQLNSCYDMLYDFHYPVVTIFTAII